ncbi:MAG: aminotransferase class I/II-fold pyridoxal phosphate-dependent enzyme, partial [Deltaproteobacteria bacterium]|nr:aminotransferase class I/II-fold pyridoxal phosphate-dependent enzyme [Deltaproteobacteria bacterium]
CPLPELIEVCREYDAVIVVDDAHGIGTLGPTGRGVAELQGVLRDVDILFGSFSKSFGGIGGFVLADTDLIEYLKLQAKSFVYSATLPVAQIEAASTALDIIQSDHSYFRRLEHNRDFFRNGLLELGFNLADSETHITPIMVGEDIATLTAGAHLYYGAGVIMMPFIYPGVPLGKARLRCNVTAAHHESDMGYTLEALAVIGANLDLIPKGSKTGASFFDKSRWVAQSKLRGIQNGGLSHVAEEVTEAGTKLKDYTQNLLGLGSDKGDGSGNGGAE